MNFSLDSLDEASRRTVKAYMNQFVEGRDTGFGELFMPDGTFEGAFSGGVLQGQGVIETHFKVNVRRFFADGMVEFKSARVQDRQVTLEWELIRGADAGIQTSRGHTILELSGDGRLQKVKAEWNPTGLVPSR